MKATKIILAFLILAMVAALILMPTLHKTEHDPVTAVIDSAPGCTARVYAAQDLDLKTNLLTHIDPQADSYSVALAPGEYVVMDFGSQGELLNCRVLTVTEEEASLNAPFQAPETQPEETAEATEPPTETTEATEPPTEAPTEPPEPTVPETIPLEEREMPMYYQNDYPDTRYGSGSLEVNGCSITCLAMLSSYMTGYEYTPDLLAGYFGGFNGNNIQRLENASTQLQLPWSKSPTWHHTLQALREGKYCIVMMNKESYFTTGQHFILLTGFTEDGQRILARDPSRKNYDHWALAQGFENGFETWVIRQGYSGAWIYDMSQMPEEPFYYYEEPHEPEYRYGDLTLTEEEIDLLAKMVFVEAQGESDEGQQAVAEVVLNRLVAPNFPNVLAEVIYAAGQFKSVPFIPDAEPTQTQYEAIERALHGPYVLDMDVVFFSRYAVNDNIWGKIGGHIFCRQWNAEN